MENEARTIEEGRANVVDVASRWGGRLSEWAPSSPETLGHWEYADMTVGALTLRVGVSGGGVVSVNGHPFAPDGTMNVTPAALGASIEDHLRRVRPAVDLPFMTSGAGHVLIHTADGRAELPSDWVGVCVDGKDTSKLWHIGQSDGERSFTRLQANEYLAALIEVQDRGLENDGENVRADAKRVDGVTYSVSVLREAEAKEYGSAREAAEAFLRTPAEDQPHMIRTERINGKERAAVVGQTSVTTHEGQPAYGKWIGGNDDALSRAYAEVQEAQRMTSKQAMLMGNEQLAEAALKRLGSCCTDIEHLDSLPGAVAYLDSKNALMVHVILDDKRVMSFGGKPAIDAFVTKNGLNEKDTKRMFGLAALANSLGKSGKAIDDVLIVTDGRHIGPVLGMKDGKALIDAGRGNLVGLDTTTLDKPPKAGDRVDVSLASGIVKAFKNLGDELSKDGQAVSVAMHTR